MKKFSVMMPINVGNQKQQSPDEVLAHLYAHAPLTPVRKRV